MGAAILQRVHFALLWTDDGDRLAGKGGRNNVPSFDLMCPRHRIPAIRMRADLAQIDRRFADTGFCGHRSRIQDLNSPAAPRGE
jgi:hypothetical protein